MEKILVIGGASQDVLYLNGKAHQTVGGAGLYTALGARAAGAQAHMLAPFPDPMPDLLRPFNELINWFGPLVHPKELPHFEIDYDAKGKANYKTIESRSESLITETVVPDDLSAYTYVHIVQMGDIDLQLRLLDKSRMSGARFLSVSGGHNLPKGGIDKFHKLVAKADFCFMNEYEAEHLLGKPQDYSCPAGTIIFVTRGRRGITLVQGQHICKVDIVATEATDPTGAGDSFCGAALANLCRLEHPILAAKNAASVAAVTVSHLGPKGLLSEMTKTQTISSGSVEIDIDKIQDVGDVMESKHVATPYTFTGMGQPEVGHPDTLDFFFALTLQEFGFWDEKNGRYLQPMFADMNGKTLKGSDYLLAAYSRMMVSDPGFFRIDRQANLSMEELKAVLADDHGNCPMPSIDLHLSEARSYGQDMLDLGITPLDVMRNTQESKTPLADFLRFLWNIGGYKDDPLQKKSALLAYILVNRPENFLKPAVGEELPPCIDYHLMRSALRTGMVKVTNDDLRLQIINRSLISSEDERSIRSAVYETIRRLVDMPTTNLDMVSVDKFFFQMRQGCPEMTMPACELCALDTVCAKDKVLFQPVIRTTYY